MDELDELVHYWKDSYVINYAKRTPHTNAKVLATIKYLASLKNLCSNYHILDPLIIKGVPQ